MAVGGDEDVGRIVAGEIAFDESHDVVAEQIVFAFQVGRRVAGRNARLADVALYLIVDGDRTEAGGRGVAGIRRHVDAAARRESPAARQAAIAESGWWRAASGRRRARRG
jgi:hypothetical protein